MNAPTLDPVTTHPATAATAAGPPDSPLQIARVESAAVVEIHVAARPREVSGDFEAQSRSMYEHLLEGLRLHGAAPADLVAERVFLEDVRRQAPLLEESRNAICDSDHPVVRPATTIVQQPPARPGQLCELQAVALLPAAGRTLTRRALEGEKGAGGGVVVETGDLRQLFLAGVAGGKQDDGIGFQRTAVVMLLDAERLVRRAGLSFRDVVRTWIFVADVDRDYAALNRARRGFFDARGVRPPPASTGIQGVPFPPGSVCALDLRAIGGTGPFRATPFGSPTMNEAPSYGADFSRGMKVETQDRTVLYVSGTASIDARGEVFAHRDIDAQIERALLNVEALLSGQGARLSDVVSAVTYLKDASYAGACRRAASSAGLPAGVPHTFCVADICRPEWLCEVEVTAVRA